MTGRGKREAGSASASPTAILLLHVQPRASRTEIVGRHGDAIKIRLAAPPVDGAANEELVRFLAERLGLRRAQVRLTAGAAARRKRFEIAGLSAAELETRLGVSDARGRRPARSR